MTKTKTRPQPSATWKQASELRWDDKTKKRVRVPLDHWYLGGRCPNDPMHEERRSVRRGVLCGAGEGGLPIFECAGCHLTFTAKMPEEACPGKPMPWG